MEQKDSRRRLTAILMADVAGYSRLMGQDESDTVRRLSEFRQVFAEQIARAHGRVVNAPGDSILAEFSSVVDAVGCAVEIQRELAEKNAELPDDHRMRFRVGLNLGDVIVQGEEIYGDGVNIAARLQALAEPGGICVSGSVYDSVQGRLELNYQFQGEQAVKNIKQPVRAYQVLSRPGAAAHRVVRAKRALALSWRKAVLAAAAALVIAGVGLSLYLARSPEEVTDSPTAMDGLPLPDQPSIAVLPFVNMSGNPEQEYFSDGITETIIADLAQLSDLLVIARNSVLTYKGKPVDVRQISRELGVRHILEGSVQKAGDRVRITAQLIEATSGNHVWAGRWDRPMEDIFAVQDEITRKIVDELNVKLVMGEQTRVWRRTAQNPEAYDYFLRCAEAFWKYTRADNARSRPLCEHALKLDPKFTLPMVWIGWSHSMDADFGWSGSQSESYDKAIAWARRAIAQDPYLGDAYTLLGDNLKDSGQDIDGGMTEMEKAVTLNPNNAVSLVVLGWHQTFVGRAQEGLENIKKAIRLNPFPPAWYLAALADGYTWTGRYEEAILVYKDALSRAPMIWAHIGLTLALSQSGRLDEARAQAEELRRTFPNFSLDRMPYTMKPEQLEILKTHLRRAGLN